MRWIWWMALVGCGSGGPAHSGGSGLLAATGVSSTSSGSITGVSTGTAGPGTTATGAPTTGSGGGTTSAGTTTGYGTTTSATGGSPGSTTGTGTYPGTTSTTVVTTTTPTVSQVTLWAHCPSGSTVSPYLGVDLDGDGSDASVDCDDQDPGTFPGAPEVPDGVDQDCDRLVDEGTVWFDDDGDGFAELAGDCDDANLWVHPARPEVAGNGLDDDCDGWSAPAYTTLPTQPWDGDGDGYGQNDCDDRASDANGDGIPDGFHTHPGAIELADWRDNDCNGVVDEYTVNFDDDCDGYTEVGGDCDDSDPSVSPALGLCP